MIKQIINGITFQECEVRPEDDAAKYHYLLKRLDPTYNNFDYGIYPVKEKMKVLGQTDTIIVRPGIINIYGREISIETPVTLTPTETSGWVQILVDLTEPFQKQVSVELSNNIYDDNLAEGGSRFGAEIARYEKAPTGININISDKVMAEDLFGDEFVDLTTSQDISGVKSFKDIVADDITINNDSFKINLTEGKGQGVRMFNEGTSLKEFKLSQTIHTNGQVLSLHNVDRTTSNKMYDVEYSVSGGDIIAGRRLESGKFMYDYGGGGYVSGTKTMMEHVQKSNAIMLQLAKVVDNLETEAGKKSSGTVTAVEALIKQNEALIAEQDKMDRITLLESNIEHMSANVDDMNQYIKQTRKAPNKDQKAYIYKATNNVKKYQEELDKLKGGN